MQPDPHRRSTGAFRLLGRVPFTLGLEASLLAVALALGLFDLPVVFANLAALIAGGWRGVFGK